MEKGFVLGYNEAAKEILKVIKINDGLYNPQIDTSTSNFLSSKGPKSFCTACSGTSLRKKMPKHIDLLGVRQKKFGHVSAERLFEATKLIYLIQISMMEKLQSSFCDKHLIAKEKRAIFDPSSY